MDHGPPSYWAGFPWAVDSGLLVGSVTALTGLGGMVYNSPSSSVLGMTFVTEIL